jgi:di- and tripeptidase/Cys-Gly metallodipeptidase DUG1
MLCNTPPPPPPCPLINPHPHPPPPTKTKGADDRALYRFGPTRFSVIPRAASGKVSIRFVPAQRADKLIERLRAHVKATFAALGSANSAAVHVHSVGDWWEADPDSDVFKMAERAIRR